MHRHALDLGSLIAGLLVLAAATAVVVTNLADVSIDGRVVVPLAVLAAGMIGLTAVLSSGRRSRGRHAVDGSGGAADDEPGLQDRP